MVIAFIVETFDTSIGAIEDVEETLGAQVLGVIAHGDIKNIQESAKDRFPKGIDEEELTKIINLISGYFLKGTVVFFRQYPGLKRNLACKGTEQ